MAWSCNGELQRLALAEEIMDRWLGDGETASIGEVTASDG